MRRRRPARRRSPLTPGLDWSILQLIFERLDADSVLFVLVNCNLLRMLRAPIYVGFVCISTVLLVDCGGAGVSHSQAPPLSITTSALIDGMVAFPYSQTIQATGGVAPLVWSVSSGNLPHNLNLGSGSNTATVAGTPDTPQTATFSVEVKDARSQSAVQSYTVTINRTRLAQLQAVSGSLPAETIEIQGVSAGPFNPLSWQQNTLNWVPDVRIPMLAAQITGPWQNIGAPWPVQQSNGWLLFYGGWDGTSTPNDRVYDVPTPDFLSFGTRSLIIDHGAFQHVNNVNVTRLSDGSMHMICTVLPGPTGLDKPAYFFSPDGGSTWNGSPAPYAAQATDVLTVTNDNDYPTSDYNGGNVLLWENNAWTLYYSLGVWHAQAPANISRATGADPLQVESTGPVLDTNHYGNDVRKFNVEGKNWYLMALYIVTTGDTNKDTNIVFFYSLSTDGLSFGEQTTLFRGATANDRFIVSLSFVVAGDSVLGVLYSGNPAGPCCAGQIFARWLQRSITITDSTGAQFVLRGGYGPDRQWFTLPSSGPIQGNITVFAEDGITPLAKGTVNTSAGQAYRLTID